MPTFDREYVPVGGLSGFFRRLFQPLPQEFSVCEITAGETHEYCIVFSSKTGNESEYIRLLLHYYAKVLFVFDPDTQDQAISSEFLFSRMQSVLDSDAFEMDGFETVLEAAEIADVATLTNLPPKDNPRVFKATTYLLPQIEEAPIRGGMRHIMTQFDRSAYEQQIVFSVFAVVQALRDSFAEQQTGRAPLFLMKHALLRMNKFYSEEFNWSDQAALVVVPNLAWSTTAEAASKYA